MREKRKKNMKENVSMQRIDEYPGTFRLLPRFDLLLRKEKFEKLPIEDKFIRMNIRKRSNCYLVDLALPGLQKEYINVEAEGNNLKVFVAVVKGQKDVSNRTISDADNCYFRKIVLPEDAEAAFAQAQYESGLLHLIVPKSAHPILISNCRIPIY